MTLVTIAASHLGANSQVARPPTTWARYLVDRPLDLSVVHLAA
jgi:hypothetical protein